MIEFDSLLEWNGRIISLASFIKIRIVLLQCKKWIKGVDCAFMLLVWTDLEFLIIIERWEMEYGMESMKETETFLFSWQARAHLFGSQIIIIGFR